MLSIRLFESQYINLLFQILEKGVQRTTRTGNTLTLFNQTIRTSLEFGDFPMITGRKLFWKNIEGEAEWMLSGSSNVKDLHKYDVHIWDQWADENGELGPTYGVQLAKQWLPVLNLLGDDYTSRRAVISLWAVNLLNHMALPPCYYALQFYCPFKGILSVAVSSRSSDAAVGLPYDMPTVSYLLIRAAQYLNFVPGEVVFNMTDVHINEENVKGVNAYLLAETHSSPLYDVQSRRNQIILRNYIASPHIPMVVKP